MLMMLILFDVYVQGTICMRWGWVGLIPCNRLRSLILRLALLMVISNNTLLSCFFAMNRRKKVWLLHYDPKNLLIHSWCYVVALPTMGDRSEMKGMYWGQVWPMQCFWKPDTFGDIHSCFFRCARYLGYFVVYITCICKHAVPWCFPSTII